MEQLSAAKPDTAVLHINTHLGLNPSNLPLKRACDFEELKLTVLCPLAHLRQVSPANPKEIFSVPRELFDGHVYQVDAFWRFDHLMYDAVSWSNKASSTSLAGF